MLIEEDRNVSYIIHSKNINVYTKNKKEVYNFNAYAAY